MMTILAATNAVALIPVRAEPFAVRSWQSGVDDRYPKGIEEH